MTVASCWRHLSPLSPLSPPVDTDAMRRETTLKVLDKPCRADLYTRLPVERPPLHSPALGSPASMCSRAMHMHMHICICTGPLGSARGAVVPPPAHAKGLSAGCFQCDRVRMNSPTSLAGEPRGVDGNIHTNWLLPMARPRTHRSSTTRTAARAARSRSPWAAAPTWAAASSR